MHADPFLGLSLEAHILTPASGICWSWSGGEGVELAELAYTQVILLAPGAVAREADASRLCHHDQQRHAPIRICYRLGRDAFGQPGDALSARPARLDAHRVAVL